MKSLRHFPIADPMRNFTSLIAVAALVVAICTISSACFRSSGRVARLSAPYFYRPSIARVLHFLNQTRPADNALMAGQGFEFDMSMAPIKDGLIQVQKPGMRYKFTAFPASRAPAKFKGLGKGTIVEMKTEVEVDVRRFQQPGGPGTEIRFNAVDINGDAAYVEFTGLFVRASDNKNFPFRILFSSVTDGSGSVFPLNGLASTGY